MWKDGDFFPEKPKNILPKTRLFRVIFWILRRCRKKMESILSVEEAPKKRMPANYYTHIVPNRFKKGGAINPGGIRRGVRAFGDVAREILARGVQIKDPFSKENIDVNVQEAMMLKASKDAVDGNYHALRIIIDLAEAKDKMDEAHIAGDFADIEARREEYKRKVHEYKKVVGITHAQRRAKNATGKALRKPL